MQALRPISVLVIAALAGCNGQVQPPVEAETPALTVELVSPTRETWPEVLNASGEVAAWQEASIGAEVGGVRLDEVKVNVGDSVRQNQLLAHFNEDVLRAELARLDAVVAEAQANLKKARADAERTARLDQSGALSKQAILQYQTQEAMATAQLASALAQRELQALRLRHARVLAPDDGIISSRTATVGSVVNAGSELFRLIRGNRMEWRAQVRADALGRLRPGMPVSVRRLDGGVVSGTLRQLSPVVNSGTRSGLAFVDLPQSSGLVSGMYVSGEFTLNAREALTLPESAIVLRDGNQYLMQVDSQGRVHEIKIEIGRRRAHAIEIIGAARPADRFVLSGGAFVNEGDSVRVTTAAGAAR